MKTILLFALAGMLATGCTTTSVIHITDAENMWYAVSEKAQDDRVFYCQANTKSNPPNPVCYEAERRSRKHVPRDAEGK